MSKFNTYIELCEMPEGELAGRTKIIMSACEIYPDENSWNANGITWLKQYIEDNIASAIGAPYVVSWLDEENQIPSNHGTMSVDDEGNIEFDGVAVGSIQDAYIGTVNIDGVDKEALITEGYLYNQRYPKFVEWLKESLANGENVKGSIEINGKGTNKNIEYLNGSTNEDGTLKIGRIPTKFDVSGLAILYLCDPSDNTSQVIEVNELNKEVIVELSASTTTDKKVSYKIDNSKESASNEKWSDVDISTVKEKAQNAKNAKAICKELALVLGENYLTNKSDLGFPHHVFSGDTLIVSETGVIAAGDRLMQNDPENETALKHINKHRKELGMELLGKTNETNSKIIVKSKSFEINELSYDDIATIITRAFNSAMSMREPDEYNYYYIYKFYPQSQTIIMTDWGTPQEYYKTTYNITNNDVTIGDITEVDMSWIPSNDEPAVEVNTSLIEGILNKNKKVEINAVSDKAFKNKMINMSEDQMNSMISGMSEDEKKNMISSMSVMIKTMKKGGSTVETNESNDQKIQELNAKVEELTSKMAELNTTVVEANKVLEAKNNEVAQMTEELNSLKSFKEEKDVEAKQAEINAYFETEVKKNGFTEVELNSLKTEYVDKMDLDGLKVKEAELCVKKVKELNSIQTQTELNTTNNDLFMSVRNTEKSNEDYSDLF